MINVFSFKKISLGRFGSRKGTIVVEKYKQFENNLACWYHIRR